MTFRPSTMIVMAALLLSVPQHSSAQVLGFGDIGFVRFNAPDSFDAVVGSPGGVVFGGGVAVIIADRPCVLYDDAPVVADPVPVRITEECDGCRRCTEHFECPSLVLAPDKSRVDIDYATCIDCGQCIDACHKGLIVAAPRP